MNKKIQNLLSSKKILITLLIAHTIIIIYYMFFGFGRAQVGSDLEGYRYSIIPTGIPLWYPKVLSFDTLKRWVFSLGNLLAFVPFGILIPLIFGIKYFKFIFIFLISIFSLEILQMVTYLGSFDIEDIMINVVGASIGFSSYKMGNKSKLLSHRIIYTAFLILIFTIIMILFAELVNSRMRF